MLSDKFRPKIFANSDSRFRISLSTMVPILKVSSEYSEIDSQAKSIKLSISPINPSQILQSSEEQIISSLMLLFSDNSIILINSIPLSRLSKPKPTNPTERPKQERQKGEYFFISFRSNIY